MNIQHMKIPVKPLMYTLYVCALGFGTFLIVSAEQATQNSGALIVKASDPAATISISQDNHSAAVIGVGSAQVHMLAGTYYVLAAASGRKASMVEQITAHNVTSVYLDLAGATPPPLVGSVQYQNLDSLTSSGLSADQERMLKRDLFDFLPSLSVAVLDPQSVQPGPHDPNSVSSFTLNFHVSLNNTPYSGQIIYPDFQSLELKLFDASNNQVYDSGLSSAVL